MGSGNARKHDCADTTAGPQGEQAEVVNLRDRVGSARGDAGNDNLTHEDALARTLPQASDELAAALRETSAAVNAIIDEAEGILAQKTKVGRAYRTAVQKAMLRILEVCAFEDLTGQRIAKVSQLLQEIEKTGGGAPPPQTGPGSLAPAATAARLDGPGLNAPHMSQAEVDAAFSK